MATLDDAVRTDSVKRERLRPRRLVDLQRHLPPHNTRQDPHVNVTVNVEFKATPHEQVRYRGTLQY